MKAITRKSRHRSSTYSISREVVVVVAATAILLTLQLQPDASVWNKRLSWPSVEAFSRRTMLKHQLSSYSSSSALGVSLSPAATPTADSSIRQLATTAATTTTAAPSATATNSNNAALNLPPAFVIERISQLPINEKLFQRISSMCIDVFFKEQLLTEEPTTCADEDNKYSKDTKSSIKKSKKGKL